VPVEARHSDGRMIASRVFPERCGQAVIEGKIRSPIASSFEPRICLLR
jgi:hypothetical protein